MAPVRVGATVFPIHREAREDGGLPVSSAEVCLIRRAGASDGQSAGDWGWPGVVAVGKIGGGWRGRLGEATGRGFGRPGRSLGVRVTRSVLGGGLRVRPFVGYGEGLAALG